MRSQFQASTSGLSGHFNTPLNLAFVTSTFFGTSSYAPWLSWGQAPRGGVLRCWHPRFGSSPAPPAQDPLPSWPRYQSEVTGWTSGQRQPADVILFDHTVFFERGLFPFVRACTDQEISHRKVQISRFSREKSGALAASGAQAGQAACVSLSCEGSPVHWEATRAVLDFGGGNTWRGAPENGPRSLLSGQRGAGEEMAGSQEAPGLGSWGGEVGRGVAETLGVAERPLWALPALVFVTGADGSCWEHGRRQGPRGWLAAPQAPSSPGLGGISGSWRRRWAAGLGGWEPGGRRPTGPWLGQAVWDRGRRRV